MRLWIDVEDFFAHAAVSTRPSGIQRLTYEVYAALRGCAATPDAVQFVRHDGSSGLRSIAWDEIDALFQRLSNGAAPPPPPAQAQSGPSATQARLRHLAFRLPPELREAAVSAALSSARALAALATAARLWARLATTMLRRITASRPTPAFPIDTSAVRDFKTSVQPGDVLGIFGSHWHDPTHAARVASLRQAHGLQVAVLVYDLIPVRFAEFCSPGVVQRFHAWMGAMLDQADQVFAISNATADDTRAYAAETGRRLSRPIVVTPIGTGFGDRPAPIRTQRLPTGPYVLFVSSIEVRKNHLLAFRAWKRLLSLLPREQVPALVFAGRQGPMVGDLMQQIANTQNLGGKLIIIDDPSDGELAALYEGCRFSLFPSFAEGWGLPVTESLGYGRPCLIAHATSLPEAAGPGAISFDPDNLGDAVDKLVTLITDETAFSAWTTATVGQFRPIPWTETARCLLRTLSPASDPR